MTELDHQKQLLLDTVFTFGWLDDFTDEMDVDCIKEITHTLATTLGITPEEIEWWERLGSSRLS